MASYSGWIYEGRHPVLGKGILDVTYCFETFNCNENYTGKAVACKDEDAENEIFYLYYLVKVKGCNNAFCADGEGSDDRW